MDIKKQLHLNTEISLRVISIYVNDEII